MSASRHALSSRGKLRFFAGGRQLLLPQSVLRTARNAFGDWKRFQRTNLP